MLVASFGLLLGLAALLGIAFVALALTEGGTRFLATQAERLLPLRLAGVSGTLGDSLEIERLTYALERQQLVVEELGVELSLWPLLFDNRLDLREVRARAVRLTELPDAPPADPEAAPAALALPFLPIEIALGRLRVAELRIEGAPIVAVSGAADWTASGLAVRELVVAGEEVTLELSGTLSAGAQPELDAVVEWTLALAGWAGRGAFAGPVDQLRVEHAVTGPYPFEVAGTVDVALPAQPGFDVAVTVADIAEEAWAVAGLSLRATGDLDAFTAEASGVVDARRGEPFPVRVVASGAAAGPLAFEVTAAPLDGEVLASGSVAWAGGLAVDARGSARALALAPLLEGYSGSLGADFALDYDAAGFDLLLTDLAGAVDGRPVAGHARVRGAPGGGWMVDAAELDVGDNRLAFAGSWAEGVLAADARVDAPALEQLGLGVGGAVTADVELAGAWPALDGKVEFRSPALTGASFEVADLAGRATLSGGELRGSVAANRIASGPVGFDALALALAGSLEALTWRLDWSAGDARGALRQLADGQRLEIATLRAEVAGTTLVTEAPLAVERRAGAVSVTPVCVTGGEARACVEGFRFRDGRIGTAGRLERLPVALLQAFLPLPVDPASFIEGSWDVAGAGAEWTGSLALAARQLGIQLPGGEDQKFTLPDVEVTGRFTGTALQAQVAAEDDALRVAGEVRLEALDPDGRLGGDVALQVKDFGWLAELDSRVAELGGVLDARVTLSGTARAPVVEGTLALRDGVVALQDPEFRLDGLAVTATVDPSGAFTLAGRGSQGDGKLELEGRGSGLFDGQLEVEAALRSEGLRATHPQYSVALGTDLALTVREGISRVTGTVELPRAEVRLNTLPTNVPQPSADVVVVGREAPVEQATPNRLRMNVRVVLGRDVSLRALGVEARLQGGVRVRRDARGQTTVRGTLDVTGGIISAQGQTLAIESGVVVYNGPIGNPYIDLRAVRQIEDQTPPVKVGLRIQGNANRLSSTIFSEPAMAENRALAFLVLGRDIDQESDADSGQLVAAAINLGLSQSKSLIAELQRATGLDELSAVAETQDSFAIAAGKRIGKDLYLRYTYNTLTAMGAILISFNLTERWRLEALSGENSAMDILYRISDRPLR